MAVPVQYIRKMSQVITQPQSPNSSVSSHLCALALPSPIEHLLLPDGLQNFLLWNSCSNLCLCSQVYAGSWGALSQMQNAERPTIFPASSMLVSNCNLTSSSLLLIVKVKPCKQCCLFVSVLYPYSSI